MTLLDAAARTRIADDTGSNLFVEAGAGSGKTSALVNRVMTLVLRDGVPLHQVAAVTFTEKAGAELRDRLRERFESELHSGGATQEQRARAQAALDDVDTAAIGTLHSFAQRILTLHPVEVGLPPLIQVLDEVASSVAFDARWSTMQRELLDDDALADHVLLALAAGVKLDQLRSLARAFGSDWDLIEERVPAVSHEAATYPDVAAVAARAGELAARAQDCSNASDKFVENLAVLAEWGRRLDGAEDHRSRYSALLAAKDLRFSYGQGKAWGGKQVLDGLRAECTDLQEEARRATDAYTEATLRPLAGWVAYSVLAAASARAAEGTLEFHDLLVLARQLLRDHAEVRASLQSRWPRLLLDEFQDTDPIQIELAVRIAGGAEADAARWEDVDLPPGSLFVVGDPKQSIYRFRRADIGLYLGVRRWFGERFGEGSVLTLTTNFRSAEPVLGWINEVFTTVIVEKPDAQPAYVPLHAVHAAPGRGSAVTVLGADQHGFAAHGNADELRRQEARDVAALIAHAVEEGWTVRDRVTGEVRPVRLHDVAVLIPARTSLPALEDALDDAAVPYRTESSSLVYQAPEVHDLLTAARVLADPSDVFSCVMALRSPLFGCGDDDLWTWKQGRGSFNILAPVPEALVEHPVAAAVTYLRRLHDEGRWMTPSEVLSALVTDRRMLDVALAGPRHRDTWRRLRFVVDQARAWSEVEHGGLRGYLGWAAKQGEESARVAEAVLPETDVDAVRVLTVHAAKGLEFPVVVLSGLTSQAVGQRGVRLLWTDTGYAVRLTGSVETNDFKDAQPVDEQMDAEERRRLLYVGATRARDHLAVSLHRGAGGRDTNARLLADAGAAAAAGAEAFSAPEETVTIDGPAPSDVASSSPPDLDAWQEWIGGVRAASRIVPAQSASGLEGTEPEVVLDQARLSHEQLGAAKGARDVDLPPWSKGRYGSTVGRAVHGVLQTVDLATGAGLDQAVAAQCTAEGVTAKEGLVRELARSALRSDLVQRASRRPHWRETYVGTVLEDGTVLEGFVDLVFREADGTLVVVDYKTDEVPPAGIPSRVMYYAPQMLAYGRALTDAVSAPLLKLLFLRPDGAIEAAVRPTWASHAARSDVDEHCSSGTAAQTSCQAAADDYPGA